MPNGRFLKGKDRINLINIISSLLYIYTYIHTCIQTYMHTYLLTYLHTYIHTYLHTYLHTYIHTYIHTYLPTYRRTDRYTYIQYPMKCPYIYPALNESVMRNSWKISEKIKIEVLVGESSISGQCSIATFDCWKVRKVAGPFPKRLSPGVSCRHPWICCCCWVFWWGFHKKSNHH